jgi:hypothetical protein
VTPGTSDPPGTSNPPGTSDPPDTTDVPGTTRWSTEAELAALSTAYASAVDERDGRRLASLFTPEGELVLPDVPRDLRPVIIRAGHEVLRHVPDGLRRYERTFHQVSNHHFTLDGDRATGEILCVAHHVGPADPGPGPGKVVSGSPAVTDTVWYIRYRDDYRRADGAWRIARRELHLQWVESRAVSLLAPHPSVHPDGAGVGAGDQASGTGWGGGGPA